MAKQTFLTDIDLTGNQLLNASLQNLATAPSTTGLRAGYVYYNTATATTMQWTGSAWLDLGQQHPTQAAISVTNTGATVLNGITVNTLGHVTATSSVALTPAIIGAEPSITTGTTGQYWSYNKTWQTLNTTAVAEGTNLYFTTGRVLGTALTGLVAGTNVAIAATDTVLTAVAKLQAQLTAIPISGSAATLTTSRSIFGNSFNGSADVNNTSLTGVTSITGSSTAAMAGFLGTSADTATLPSYSFTGDTNTGMWSGAADTLGFSVGGVNRLTINTIAITSSLAISAPSFAGAGTNLTGTATSLNIGGNAATATKLATARAIWGQNFDGSAAISGNMSNVGDVSMNGTLYGAIDVRIPLAKAGTATAGSIWVGTGATAGVIAASALAGLSDVVISSPVANQALVYNGSTWGNAVVTSVNDNLTSTTQTWSSSKINQAVSDINSTITGGLVNKGGYDASANSPLLNSATPIAGIKNGWTYVVTVAGTFFTTEPLSVGDMIIAKQDNPTALAHWTIVNKNIPDIVQASTSAQGIVQLATSAEAISGSDANKAITAAALQAKVASTTALGLVQIADQTTVNAGTDTLKAVTPATLTTYVTNYVGGYSATFGDGTATTFNFTHNLNTLDVEVQVVEVSTGQTVFMQVQRTSTTVVNVQCNVAPTASQYRVVIKK